MLCASLERSVPWCFATKEYLRRQQADAPCHPSKVSRTDQRIPFSDDLYADREQTIQNPWPLMSDEAALSLEQFCETSTQRKVPTRRDLHYKDRKG